MPWKAIVLVIIAVAALFVAWQFDFWEEKVVDTDLEEAVQMEEKGDNIPKTAMTTTPPPATGNIDDAMAEIAADADLDASLFAEESAETKVLDEDGQAVGDFGGVYNESEF